MITFFRTYAIQLHIFLVVLLIAGFFARYDVDLHHDGLVFKPALDVTRGLMLYKNTYTLYGGLTVLIQALAVKMVGPYVIAVRWVTALTYALTAVVLWRIWSAFLNKGWSLAAMAIWIGLSPYFTEPFYPWSSIYALFLVVVLLDRLVSWSRPTSFTQKKSSQLFTSWQLVVLGCLAGLTFLVKQPYILVLGALMGYVFLLGILRTLSWSEAFGKIGWLLLGFVIPVALFVWWVFSMGALQDFWLQTVRIGYIYGKILGISYARHTFLATNGVWLTLLLVPVVMVLKSVHRLRKQPHDLTAIQSLGVATILVASISHYFPVFDHSHAFWAASPAIGFAIYVITSWLQMTRRIIVKALIFGWLGFLFFGVGQGVTAAILKVSQPCAQLSYPVVVRGLCLTPADALYLVDVTTTIDMYLAKHPNKVFVMNTENPLYVTFTNKVFYPRPLFFNNSGYTSGIYPFEIQLKEFIDRQRPLVMVTPQNINWISGYSVLKQWPDRQIVLLQPN